MTPPEGQRFQQFTTTPQPEFLIRALGRNFYQCAKESNTQLPLCYSDHFKPLQHSDTGYEITFHGYESLYRMIHLYHHDSLPGAQYGYITLIRQMNSTPSYREVVQYRTNGWENSNRHPNVELNFQYIFTDGNKVVYKYNEDGEPILRQSTLTEGYTMDIDHSPSTGVERVSVFHQETNQHHILHFLSACDIQKVLNLLITDPKQWDKAFAYMKGKEDRDLLPNYGIESDSIPHRLLLQHQQLYQGSLEYFYNIQENPILPFGENHEKVSCLIFPTGGFLPVFPMDILSIETGYDSSVPKGDTINPVSCLYFTATVKIADTIYTLQIEQNYTEDQITSTGITISNAKDMKIKSKQRFLQKYIVNQQFNKQIQNQLLGNYPDFLQLLTWMQKSYF